MSAVFVHRPTNFSVVVVAAGACCAEAVALAHGLHASRIDGSPLVYNQADTSRPDLLICRPELADRVLTEVGALAL